MPPRCHPFVNLPFPKIVSILKICSQDRTRIVCNLIRSRPWKECTFERETRQRMARNFNVGEEVWVEEEWGIITAEESKQGALFPRSSLPPTSFLPRRVYESTSIREGQTSKVHRALPPFFRAPSFFLYRGPLSLSPSSRPVLCRWRANVFKTGLQSVRTFSRQFSTGWSPVL